MSKEELMEAYACGDWYSVESFYNNVQEIFEEMISYIDRQTPDNVYLKNKIKQYLDEV